MFKRFGNGEGGGGGELGRFLRGVAPAHDAGEGLEVVSLEEGFRDEDESRGAVGERGGVGGGDGAGAIGYEGRFHAPEFLLVERHLGFFVLVHHRRGFAPGAGDLHGCNFLGEEAVLGGFLGFLDGADGVGVLVGAGNGVVAAAFFGCEAHVFAGVGVGEAVFEEAVDEGVVAVFAALSQSGKVVGDVGHGLGAAGYDAGGVAGHDGLGGEDDGFGARGAHLVYGGADGRFGEAGVHGALAGRVLAKTAEDV